MKTCNQGGNSETELKVFCFVMLLLLSVFPFQKKKRRRIVKNDGVKNDGGHFLYAFC